eukprot:CAMPEP_0170186780 /NCGR_PEP_ID=MMETSP0040_2-20121228/40152_1 /TAXON_ID=641309 /ORGANISM="Lotharella oceanica, Strain CCMP622" /LENGTH=64 /DNA_ID=CAMNT_0010433641 /DNA_START=429 /DNA_END=623 /DNA_ORIENTATION=-
MFYHDRGSSEALYAAQQVPRRLVVGCDIDRAVHNGDKPDKLVYLYVPVVADVGIEEHLLCDVPC